jgi:hypothetical protein
MTARAHFIRSLLFLLLFMGPGGAPIIGAFISGVCPIDNAAIGGDGPFAMAPSSCGIYGPAEQFYRQMGMLIFVPMLVVGPLAGMIIAVLWWICGLGSAVSCLRHLGRGIGLLVG